MLLSHESNKVLITGASGCGKSTYWTKLVLGYPAATRFVFDHEGELQQRLRVRAARSPAALAEGARRGWCIYDPDGFHGDFEAAFNFFAEFAFEASDRLPGVKLFACDELQEFVGTHTLERFFKRILQRGRRRGLDLVAVSHQPNELHNLIRGQFTEVVSFVQCEAGAIEWLVKYGFQEPTIRALRPGEYACRRRGELQETRGRVF